MIVVDTSALVAILLGEPEAPALTERLVAASARCLAAPNYIELGTVLAGRRKVAAERVVHDTDRILSAADIAVVPLTAALARDALAARIRFGKGFGAAAGLNFGDCFAYALARSLNAPLLYIGNDLAATDVKPA